MYLYVDQTYIYISPSGCRHICTKKCMFIQSRNKEWEALVSDPRFVFRYWIMSITDEVLLSMDSMNFRTSTSTCMKDVLQ